MLYHLAVNFIVSRVRCTAGPLGLCVHAYHSFVTFVLVIFELCVPACHPFIAFVVVLFEVCVHTLFITFVGVL